MMKIMLPTTMMILFNNTNTININLSYIIIMILLTNMSFMMSNATMLMDMLSYLMIILTMMSVMLIIISTSSLKKIISTMIPILIILMMVFFMSNMINFYIMFELVLIPTMMLIMMNGKQPERLQASIYLMMYTITASLPLLISIIFIKNNPSFFFSKMMMMNFNTPILMLLAFLVKTPMYFMHLWLPKAHVEAPLEGSMILAAILLKLGGYGLLRFMPLCLKKLNNINYWIISISLMGASATSLNCIRQKDLKSLIAYSSIAHMSMTLMGIFTMSSIGLNGAIMMMIAHGLSSSALFVLANDMYMKYYSRNIMLFKGILLMTPNITFWWFMFMAINISAPPSINTLSEIFIMSSMLSWNMSSMLMIFIMSLMTTSFSMMMYINISNNKNMMLPSMHSQLKTYMSLFLHLTPLIIMLMKMEMMSPALLMM